MNLTTVGDLMDALEDYDRSSPIMLAHQPSWPLAEVLSHLISDEERAEDEEEADEHDDPIDNVVWLVAGGHHYTRSPYAPRSVFEGP